MVCCRTLLQGRLDRAHLAMNGHTVEHAAGVTDFENPPELLLLLGS